MNRKIIDIIKNEKSLGEIKLRFSISEKIISKIEAIEMYRKVFLLNFYKKLAVAVSFVIVLFIGSVFLKRGKEHKVLITYPYNGESKVELIGSFNNWERKIPMEFDEEKKLWKTEIIIKKKGLFEYQFIIDNVIFTTGETIYKIKDKNGNEKAIISI
ncbi:MAG: glycogen-binding domain-containing protein [Brevinematales bacterium]|nr:glycogen-binding domain-containing protein [Brevinematales bacterium]